ncbi:MAG TPA: GHKL domain-containing protein [Candidatus Cloacimonetes bacterium]|nr:GHKL domain-containing protein [Candidatus Cloacimonadota bacterium]HEX37522.1 GHKL domain-containing protein [Candidatus Cloacimonadota bacterium]
MIFNNFKINIILRILLLSISIFALLFIYFSTEFHITLLFVGFIIVIEIVSLIYYVDKTNRDLSNLLDSIQYSDFSRTFKIEKEHSSYTEFKQAFNKVIEKFKIVREEKEEQYHYLQNVLQHIGIALIAFRKNGKVEMMNKSARKLFRIHNLRNILLLKEFSSELVDKILSLKSEEKSLIKIQDNDELLQLAIYATEFTLNERVIKLVSIQNIQHELEEQEMEAWQKLIRVLTHEIMNSIAPIASISSTINSILQEIKKDPDGKEVDEETQQDIREALTTIHRRSTGLLHFVETYRNLTRIPKPTFKIFPIKNLFNHVTVLLEDEMKENGIFFKHFIYPQSLEITADEDLLQQVVINLLRNALQGVQGGDKPEIELKAFQNERGKTIIQVIDNGSGIPADSLDKIFVPFFTTKKDGSGIGLSLSRQIMRLHGGTITVASEPGVKTEFTLKF